MKTKFIRKLIILLMLAIIVLSVFTGCMKASAIEGGGASATRYMPFETLTADAIESVTFCGYYGVETEKTLDDEAVEALLQMLKQIKIAKEITELEEIWLGGDPKFYVLKLADGTKISVGAFCASSIDNLFYLDGNLHVCENQDLLEELNQKHQEDHFAYYADGKIEWTPRPAHN